MITYDTIDKEEPILEPEALEIAANGSHEARVFEALRHAMDGLTVAELEAALTHERTIKSDTVVVGAVRERLPRGRNSRTWALLALLRMTSSTVNWRVGSMRRAKPMRRRPLIARLFRSILNSPTRTGKSARRF